MNKNVTMLGTSLALMSFAFGLMVGLFVIDMSQPEPIVKTVISENRVEVIKEVPVVKERVVCVEVIQEVERMPETKLTDEEKILMAKLIHAEAGSEDYIGKRLVADVILNRVGTSFGNSVTEVVYKPGQFTHPSSTYTEQDLAAVEAECYERLDYEIMYFRANYFFSGHPKAYQHGGHFFSY